MPRKRSRKRDMELHKPKKIRGVLRFPVKVIAKGKDWVDWRRPDGLESRTWDFMHGFKQLKRTRVGSWIFFPAKPKRK